MDELTPTDLGKLLELLPATAEADELREKIENVLRELAKRVAFTVRIKTYPFLVE